MIAERALADSTQYVVNTDFTKAVVYFRDGSHLAFEHTSRQNRWAKASSAGSIADGLCLLLKQFRLNAKHLQLYFEDGSDAEFFARGEAGEVAGKVMKNHKTKAELEAGLEDIRNSPKDAGTLLCIVRRPRKAAREVLREGYLDPAQGLSGDNWVHCEYAKGPDGSFAPETQLTLMNSRAIQLIAQQEDRWPLAGDQLYVELDLSHANLPPGTRLALGDAIIEISQEPHTGCRKFVDRFGLDAMKFVNSPQGKELNLRGIYAKVVKPGVIRVGDVLTRAGGAA